MLIQSKTVEINASMDVVNSFISCPKNLSLLLPEDKVQGFQSSEDDCSFLIQGGIKICLILADITKQTVQYRSGEHSPFSFLLTVEMNEENEVTSGKIRFESELNSFMKMLVEKPLLSLFDHMAARLISQFPKN